MTCIVGIQHEGRVYIGGDSAGVAGRTITTRADVKVFTVGPYVMGFTSSFRMGQLLRYSLRPTAPTGNLDRFMVTTFADEVRSCWESGGYLATEGGRESGGCFLVGIEGTLYSFESDHQICRSRDDYLAIGCADDVALGSLFTTQGEHPRDRIKKALKAAAYHNTGVCGPFVVRSSGVSLAQQPSDA